MKTLQELKLLQRRGVDFFNEKFLDDIYETFTEIGFEYTTLDLKGYRTGSMNETINKV